MPRITDVVKNLLILNIAVFVIAQMIFGLSPQLAMYFPSSRYFEPYQIVTHMFAHGDFGHLFFNMFGLYMFGSIVEYRIGAKKTLMLYFISGLGALITQLLLSFVVSPEVARSTSLLGASGAVYGLAAAFMTLFPNMKVLLLIPPIPIKAKYLAVVFIVMGLFSASTGLGGNIAHFAHLGGAIFGFLLILYWRSNRQL